MRTVARINVAPVKGFRLAHPAQVTLGRDGVLENRRFFLVGPDGQRLRSSLTAWPCLVSADYDAVGERLTLRFPDGSVVAGEARARGERIHSTSGALDVAGRLVEGPWQERLSLLAGYPVRLARADSAGAGLTEPVTLVSDASVARLEREAGRKVDARRFRMLFELAGCDEHEEDGWEGLLLRVGQAVLRVGGPVDRCAVTTRDPDTGDRDLDTLRLIAAYRGRPRGSVDFGVYARVERPGVVRIGDRVEPLGCEESVEHDAQHAG